MWGIETLQSIYGLVPVLTLPFGHGELSELVLAQLPQILTISQLGSDSPCMFL
jgi:hypothetical protein